MLYQVTSSPTCIGLSFPNLNKAIQFLELKLFFHFESIYLFLKVFLYFCSFLLYNVIKDDVGVKTINKFNPIPYSTLKNSYFVVYRRGLGNI